MPSVAINGGTFTLATRMPLIKPGMAETDKATSKAIRIVGRGAIPAG